MGVDYRYYLIPRPNSFLPEPRQLATFLQASEAEQWLRPRYPGWIAKETEGRMPQRQPIALQDAAKAVEDQWSGGIRMAWRLWRRDADIPYDLEIHVSPRDYIYHTSETVDGFGGLASPVNCAICGTRLDFDAPIYLFGVNAIHASCPKCGTFFDPSEMPATYTDGWTGEKTLLLGGATYRFALLIDNVPPEEWQHFRVDPEFMTLCKRIFACSFYGFGDYS